MCRKQGVCRKKRNVSREKVKIVGRCCRKTGVAHQNTPLFLLPQGAVFPKDGLCPSECPPHFLFLLAKKKTCRTRYKRKSVRDELTRKGPTHPKRGAGRYALPIKSKSFLPAAPIGVPCGTALPHLGAQNSLGCKEDAPCSLFRCRWRSFAERAALKIGRASYRERCRSRWSPYH